MARELGDKCMRRIACLLGHHECRGFGLSPINPALLCEIFVNALLPESESIGCMICSLVSAADAKIRRSLDISCIYGLQCTAA